MLSKTTFQQDGMKCSVLCGSTEKRHLGPDWWGYWWEADECPKRRLEEGVPELGGYQPSGEA